MSLTRILTLVARGMQLLCGAVVLGVSLTAVRWQVYGHVPATNGYAAFAGGIGLLTALIGITACFKLQLENPMLLVDAITAALLFAGGVAYAIQLKGVNCKDKYEPTNLDNKLINGGFWKDDDNNYDWGVHDDVGLLLKHCKMAEANTAFLFLTALAVVAALVLAVLAFRKAKRSYGSGV